MIKKILIGKIALSLFIFGFWMLLAQAAQADVTTALNPPAFKCGTHGFHQWLYCPPSEGTYYFDGGAYENYYVDFSISGHRHGSSTISAVICLQVSDGGQGPCGQFYGKGNDLGEEYGDYHPFHVYPDTVGGHLQVTNVSEVYHIAMSALIEDAEVCIGYGECVGGVHGSASRPDAEPPIPPTGAIQTQSNLTTNATITGPQNYIGFYVRPNYDPLIFWEAPLGTYTISNISNISCYSYSVRPPGTTQTITTNGEAIFFIIDYSDSCPTPSLTFTASPNPINYNTASTLTWTVQYAQSCTASGDWSGAKDAGNGSHNQSTGNITSTKTYTLTCSGQDGNDISTQSVTVTVNPPAPNTPTNVTEVDPNYCVSGPGGTISWNYSDPAGSPQTAYNIQVTNTGNFNNPMYDSNKLPSSGWSGAIPGGILSFNTTYKARVRVWNSYDIASGWSNPTGSWKTPTYAYPQVAFIYTPNKPQQNVLEQFTDQTVFGGGNENSRQWSWTFGDGGSSTNQNPTHTYVNTGTFTVTDTVTDAANQSCSLPKIFNVQKPIPVIKEVAPK